jgi:predicted solute-binding protein
VPYLNVAPLVFGLEGRLRLLPPSQLAVALREGEIDAGLLSITEALFCEDYDVLEGPCVASFGEVLSVFLAHRRPLDEVRRVWCDTASLTSVNLLRVLLAERGLRPEFVPLTDPAAAAEHDFSLLIGDPALRFRRQPREHAILDLGADWRELTGLPFVYAAWVLRREADTRLLRAELLAAAARGRENFDAVIRDAPGFDEAFRRRYLTENVRNAMGPGEQAGVRRFAELLRRHTDRPVYEPRFVG